MAPQLVGPPELHRKITTTTATAQADPTSSESDPSVDQMGSGSSKYTTESEPEMGLTENNSATLLSTGNPCLDFFFHIVPNTPAASLIERLEASWRHNPLTTLKLVCNLRGVRGTGKSDKEGFYTAALWLHTHHPETLAINVPSLAEFGYFKDLPEILYRILEGAEVRVLLKEQRPNKRKSKGLGESEAAKKKQQQEECCTEENRKSREARIMEEKERAERAKEEARKLKEERKINAAKKAIERYDQDPNYRFLFESISDLFAACLKSDLESLNSNKPNKVSLAAKWCPSLDSSFDRSTLLCESIACKLFPKESYPEYHDVEDAHYAYRVRDRLRKEFFVPLRKTLELPEVYMSGNRWNELPYNRVPSVAMKNYKELFTKHDEERFQEYLEDVKEGKTTIAAGALLPHEIIASLDDGDGGEVANLQWKRMVDDLKAKGKLSDCLAICDVSGSMNGTPMEVCVALGLLVSELSEEPWKGKVITFSSDPQLHIIEGVDLRSQTQFLRGMDWGYNTNFQKVFDVILAVAEAGKLRPDQMIKRLFVFSDMEFDGASANPWETDYEVIVRKFGERGYGDAVPEIVFWNLRYSMATPVSRRQNGVALVSGFSKNLMKLFLENGGEVNPEEVMEAAISRKEYQKLVVVD